jgi:ribosome-associated protein
MPDPIEVAPGVLVPALAIRMNVSRSSGPGGQNVNKVSSKVELRVQLSGIRGLTPAAQARLRALAGRRLDAEGCLVVTSQRTRDQHLNREDAREKVRRLIERALTAPRGRRPTRPGRAAKARRLAEKRQHSARKAERRRGAAED